MVTRRFRPLDAVRSLRRLIADPTQTEEAFAILRAIDPHGPERLQRFFRASETGRRLLREQPDLLAALSDRAALAAMPAGSLGAAYLAFCEREGITPGGLVEASTALPRELEGEQRWIGDRMRDSHDLWHVVTGCRTDLAGELAVLTFTTAQTHSRGTGMLVLGGIARSFTFPGALGARGRALAGKALRRGLRAESLVVAPWEELLPLPLAEVRRRLGVEALPPYQPYYAHDVAPRDQAGSSMRIQ